VFRTACVFEMSEILKSWACFAPADGLVFCCRFAVVFECVCTEGQYVCVGTKNTDATYETKSIIGNTVNLSIAEVRFHRVLPADRGIHAHVGKGGRYGTSDR